MAVPLHAGDQRVQDRSGQAAERRFWEQDSLPLSFQERYPHLEEAYWFGEGVNPDPAARGLLPGTAVGRGAPLLVASGG
jgi:hypothetical protein